MFLHGITDIADTDDIGFLYTQSNEKNSIKAYNYNKFYVHSETVKAGARADLVVELSRLVYVHLNTSLITT